MMCLAIVAAPALGLAQEGPPKFDWATFCKLRSDDPGEREAAAVSVRAAARWAIEHGDASMVMPPTDPEPILRLPTGRFLGGIASPQEPRIENPFVLAVPLRDPRPEVRAAAAVALRRRLGVPPRATTLAAAGPAPASWVRELWADVDVPVGLLPRVLDEARAGRVDPALHGSFAHLDEDTARHFAAELVRAVMSLGEDPPRHRGPLDPRPHLRYAPRGPLDATAVICFAAALRIHPVAQTVMLSHAYQATNDTVRRRAMSAIDQACERMRRSGEHFVAGAAPMAMALLGAAEPVDRLVAAQVLWLVESTPEAERRAIAELAMQRLPHLGEPADERMQPLVTGGDVNTILPWEPRTVDQLVVMTAAQSGATELIEPMLAGIRAATPVAPEASFMVHALGALLPAADEVQLRRVFELASLFQQPGFPGLAMELNQLYLAMYEFVPDDLAHSYKASEKSPEIARLLEPLQRGSEPFRPRIVELLSHVDWNSHLDHLLPRAPRLLLMAIDAGDLVRARLIGGVCFGETLRTLLPELLRRPPEAVAAALIVNGGRDRPLELLAYVRDVPTARLVLAQLIPLAPPANDELPLLRDLCAVDHAATAAAAAIRARSFGTAGRTLWRETVQRLCRESDEAAGQALRAMLAAGEAIDGWREAAQRARTPDFEAALAADLRFGGVAVDAKWPNLCRVLRLAGVGVDMATMHSMAPDARLLEDLLSTVPIMRAAGLDYAASVPLWSPSLERMILLFTADADSTVRRAAYQALASRDPELWPCAWLAHEAAFDPEPTVRGVVPPALPQIDRK